MPIQVDTKTGGAEYDGTAGSGLLDPGYLGNSRNRVVIRGIWFTTSSTIGSWSLVLQNTAGATVGTLLSNTSTTFAVFGGSHGCVTLPADEGQSYRLAFTTSATAGDSVLTIDYDIVQGAAP